jgi:hypothetical protein
MWSTLGTFRHKSHPARVAGIAFGTASGIRPETAGMVRGGCATRYPLSSTRDAGPHRGRAGMPDRRPRGLASSSNRCLSGHMARLLDRQPSRDLTTEGRPPSTGSRPIWLCEFNAKSGRAGNCCDLLDLRSIRARARLRLISPPGSRDKSGGLGPIGQDASDEPDDETDADRDPHLPGRE